ncbi:MAG: cell envelope integrity protein TolA [Gammaproteobacteria bacterium]|nr:cell envelope integrity protein TolA [Gammaproteobacteria bacterium]
MDSHLRRLGRPVRAVVLAIAVHVVLLMLLGLGFYFQPNVIRPTAAVPINAVAVDKAVLDVAKAKKEKAKKEKAKKEKEKAEREQAKKEQAEREKQRQLQEERQVEEAAYSAISALVGRIWAKVRQNWNKPPGSMAGLETVISVKVQRTGEVVSVKVVKSSGNVYFDQSAENAVYKASPLPFPDEPRYYEFIKEFNFKFVPDRN